MARWGFKANKGAGNVQTVVGITAAASSPRRARVHDLTMGCGASPADNAFTWMIQRSSSAGTGSALTPNALDAADTLASTIVVKDTVTIEPTLTASAFLYAEALNQRATMRWVAAPYSELVVPATASNGFSLGLTAATTTSFDAGGHYEEM